MHRRRFLAATAAVALVPAVSRAVTPDGTFMVESHVLAGQRRVNIALPPGYAGSKRKYPVLYLLDGGTVQEDFPKITDFVAQMTAAGTLAPMIVVGIEGVDRKHDLTHPATFVDDLKLLPQSGGSAAYRRFLVDELQPWVNDRYRVNGQRGLIGESLAGLFTVETFLREPRPSTPTWPPAPACGGTTRACRARRRPCWPRGGSAGGVSTCRSATRARPCRRASTGSWGR